MTFDQSNSRRYRIDGRTAVALTAALLLGLLAGCSDSGGVVDYNYPTRSGSTHRYDPTGTKASEANQSVFGEGGLLGGVLGGKKDGEGGAGIGVNSFLWRATLDTLAFMPLSSADPFGGVIITDWYSPQETPGERFKMTVYILDRQLRADGVKVAVFRQSRAGDQWVDAGVSTDTATNLENAILRKARQLRTDVAQQ